MERYLDQWEKEGTSRNETLEQLIEDCGLLVPMLHPKYDTRPILKLVAIAENMGKSAEERIGDIANA